MKTHYKMTKANLISFLISLLTLFCLINLTGCSSMLSSKMPQGSISMENSYSQALNGTSASADNSVDDGSLQQVRTKVNNLNLHSSDYNAYTRTQENEINSQFPQLLNPSIVMYVYPHQAGTGDNITPVPGYSTIFPLYEHVYYAMPGEINYRVKQT